MPNPIWTLPLQNVAAFAAGFKASTSGDQPSQTVYVKDYATGGTGGALDPYTGWETRITWQGDTEYIFDSGWYIYASVQNWAYRDIRLRGIGNVVIKCTGTRTYGILFDGGLQSAPDNAMRNIIMENFTIVGPGTARGNGTILQGMYQRNIHISTFKNITFFNFVDVGLRSEFCISCLYETIAVSSNMDKNIRWVNGVANGTSTGVTPFYPLVGIIRDVAESNNSYPCTDSVFLNCVIEGLGVGSTGYNLIRSWFETIIGGTSENNGTGISLGAGCTDAFIMGVDFEGNNTGDVDVQGTNNRFVGCVLASTNPGSIGGSSCSNNVFRDIRLNSGNLTFNSNANCCMVDGYILNSAAIVDNATGHVRLRNGVLNSSSTSWIADAH